MLNYVKQCKPTRQNDLSSLRLFISMVILSDY